MKLEDGVLFSIQFRNNKVEIISWSDKSPDNKRFGQSIELSVNCTEQDFTTNIIPKIIYLIRELTDGKS